MAGTAVLTAGIVSLRAANRAGPAHRSGTRACGWMLIIAGFGIWSFAGKADLTIALAALMFSLGGYCVVALSLQVRTRRSRDRRQRHQGEAPLNRARPAGRIVIRTLLAGPLSLIFGLALAVVTATRVPIAPVNAVMLAGLGAPVAIAAAMAWSLSAERLLRVAIGLSVPILVMTGLSAWLP